MFRYYVNGTTMKMKEILRVAERTARKSPCRFKVSCILVDQTGDIVATGYNHYGTKKRMMGKPTVHAEVDALNKVRKPSPNLTAFIYRDNGKLITPCKSCQRLLAVYGIRTVWHSIGIGEGMKKWNKGGI